MDIWREKGFGYVTSDKKICMVRCFSCGLENWAMAVASGGCAWCHFNPNTDNLDTVDAEQQREQNSGRRT